MRKSKEEQGITLIALIITIIVLLILALVTLNAIQGDGDLIAYANNAGSKYTAEGANENSLIQNALAKLNKYGSNESQKTIDIEYTLTNDVNQEKIDELSSYLIDNNLAYYDDHDKKYWFQIYAYLNDEEESVRCFSITFDSQNKIDKCYYETDELWLEFYIAEKENVQTYKWVEEVYDDDNKTYNHEEVTDFPIIKRTDIEQYIDVSIEENDWEGSKDDFIEAVDKVLETFFKIK